VLLKAKIVVV